MKLQAKKLAPFGLYLSLVATLASVGLYIVQRSFNLPLQISLGLIVVGLALFAILDPDRLRRLLAGRQARYGSNAFILTIAFIGILVVINVLVYNNSKRWDLTEDKTNTLAKESIDTLKSLKEPVKAEAFYSSSTPSDTARTLLDSYKYNSGGKFDYEFIDPVKDPVRAKADNVTSDGTIVLKQGTHLEQVSFAGEQDITSGLVRLANPGKRAVYFLTGHGEYNPDDTSGDRSYNQVKQALTAKNYTVNTLNLLSTRQIPADALALIIAGADKPLSSDEVVLIKAYVDKGGSLVLLSEPRIVTQFGNSPDPLQPYLVTDWGIQLGEDMVIDLNYDPPVVAVSASYGQHSITNKMNNQAVIMPSARTIDAAKTTNPDVQQTVLIQTAKNSWGETDAQSITDNKISFNEKTDLAGPVSLAIAAMNNKTQARIVVVGDSDFASSKNFAQYGNGDFLINSIDWAAKQENLISLTAKTPTQRMIAVRSQVTLGLVLLTTVFVIPGFVIVSGVSVWIRRRRRG
jgi:ABC-type uncharacterized transport system involved in gliding motility auxiliary subunit